MYPFSEQNKQELSEQLVKMGRDPKFLDQLNDDQLWVLENAWEDGGLAWDRGERLEDSIEASEARYLGAALDDMETQV